MSVLMILHGGAAKKSFAFEHNTSIVANRRTGFPVTSTK
jgi:hypothetical protein